MPILKTLLNILALTVFSCMKALANKTLRLNRKSFAKRFRIRTEGLSLKISYRKKERYVTILYKS